MLVNTMSKKIIATTFMAASVFCTSALAQDATTVKAATLPSGATSLSEVFEDWTVACSAATGATQCAVSQTQQQANSGQHVLTAAFNPLDESMTLVLPFGLELVQGVTVQLDDGPEGKPFLFKTCVPNGCIVPMNIDTAMLNSMRKGQNLKLTGVSTTMQKVPLQISLKGFSAAVDRVNTLISTN